MQWLNEPVSWQRTADMITVSVDPATDFWRETGYGYIRDSGHIYGEVLAGDLDISVRVRGSFSARFDQAGVMLRVDDRVWLKTGLEFFEGRARLSTVLTLGQSSWIMTDLPEGTDDITLRVSRRGDAVEVRYLLTEEGPAELAALVYLPPGRELLAGVMCAAPEGPGFGVTFQDLYITPQEWDEQGQPAQAEWPAAGAESDTGSWVEQPSGAGVAGWEKGHADGDQPGWRDSGVPALHEDAPGWRNGTSSAGQDEPGWRDSGAPSPHEDVPAWRDSRSRPGEDEAGWRNGGTSSPHEDATGWRDSGVPALHEDAPGWQNGTSSAGEDKPGWREEVSAANSGPGGLDWQDDRALIGDLSRGWESDLTASTDGDEPGWRDGLAAGSGDDEPGWRDGLAAKWSSEPAEDRRDPWLDAPDGGTPLTAASANGAALEGRPPADEPAAEQPSADQSRPEQPRPEQALAEWSPADEPAAEQPSADQSRPEQPRPEQALAEWSPADEPVAGRSLAGRSLGDRSPTEWPSADQPGTEPPPPEVPMTDLRLVAASLMDGPSDDRSPPDSSREDAGTSWSGRGDDETGPRRPAGGDDPLSDTAPRDAAPAWLGAPAVVAEDHAANGAVTDDALAGESAVAGADADRAVEDAPGDGVAGDTVAGGRAAREAMVGGTVAGEAADEGVAGGTVAGEGPAGGAVAGEGPAGRAVAGEGVAGRAVAGEAGVCGTAPGEQASGEAPARGAAVGDAAGGDVAGGESATGESQAVDAAAGDSRPGRAAAEWLGIADLDDDDQLFASSAKEPGDTGGAIQQPSDTPDEDAGMRWFSTTSLTGAGLDSAALDSAALGGAALGGAGLDSAALTGAALTGAALTGAGLADAGLGSRVDPEPVDPVADWDRLVAGSRATAWTPARHADVSDDSWPGPPLLARDLARSGGSVPASGLPTPHGGTGEAGSRDPGSWDEGRSRSDTDPGHQQPSDNGSAQAGMASSGTASPGMAQQGTGQQGTALYGTEQYGAAQYGAAQYGTAQHGKAQYGTEPYGTERYGTALHRSILEGLSPREPGTAQAEPQPFDSQEPARHEPAKSPAGASIGASSASGTAAGGGDAETGAETGGAPFETATSEAASDPGAHLAGPGFYDADSTDPGSAMGGLSNGRGLSNGGDLSNGANGADAVADVPSQQEPAKPSVPEPAPGRSGPFPVLSRWTRRQQPVDVDAPPDPADEWISLLTADSDD